MAKRNLHGSLIVTYRCNAKCVMCGCHRHPTDPREEWSPGLIRKLPEMAFANITGGEPFLRGDLPEIVRELHGKADRIVISTNGWFTERILDLCGEFPRLGIRVSIDGLGEANDAIRGLPGGFDRGFNTLKRLMETGCRDVGFGMTLQDGNAGDLVPLYRLSDSLGMEFATAAVHNSFYFHKPDNTIKDKLKTARALEALINELLASGSPKKWFRAYFNHGLINYVYGQPRLLPCGMGCDAFFLDPYGEVLPCNGMDAKLSMGNLNDRAWHEIWSSRQADCVRRQVKDCAKNCWMIGSVSPAMHRRLRAPAAWVLRHKLTGGYSLEENAFMEEACCRP